MSFCVQYSNRLSAANRFTTLAPPTAAAFDSNRVRNRIESLDASKVCVRGYTLIMKLSDNLRAIHRLVELVHTNRKSKQFLLVM